MVYSPPNNDQKSQIPLAGSVAHLVTSDIDAGATRLQPPKIRSVHGRQASSEKRRTVPVAKPPGPITVWETPYNRPAFDTPENIQYTRLALQYLQQGRIEDAERLYKQALVVAERTFAATDSAVFRAIEDLAGFYFAHERYQQAEPLVSRLLKYRIDNLPCDDWLLIRTVDQLAEIYEKCGQPLNAQSLYKLLLARQEDIVGRKSLVCAFTLSRLAESYLRQDRLQTAETLMLTILEIQEGAHGRCSIEISTTLQELASIYHKLGRIDKAAEMLERLLHVLETIHGDCGLSVASCLLKLADLLAEVGMTFEAEPLYRRAQEIYRISYGDTTAAHSVFKRKLDRVNKNHISKASKDKPRDQEECARFPAVRLNLDDMLPSKLGTGQVNRCLGHAVSAESTAVQPAKPAPVKTMTVSGADPLLDSLFVVYADSVDVSISTSEWCLTDELVKSDNPPIPTLQDFSATGLTDDFAARSAWHQVWSETYTVDPGRAIDTLKLPAFEQPEQSLRHQSNSEWTAIEFEPPQEKIWEAVPPAPMPELFAALIGDTLAVHVPRHIERMPEQPLPWHEAGANSGSKARTEAHSADALLQAAPQSEPVSTQLSLWHQVGTESNAVDPGRAFETLQLPSLRQNEPVSESLPGYTLGSESSDVDSVSTSDSLELHASDQTKQMPELAPPLHQVYAETYSLQADRTAELIPSAVLQEFSEEPVSLKGDKTAEMVPPVAPPWTSQNYITGLLENIAVLSLPPADTIQEAVEVEEFVESREGILEALKGMTVTLLEASVNVATPIDMSPPTMRPQNPDMYFQVLIDEIAGSPPAPLARLTRGELIQPEADFPKPASMKTTTRMPYLDPQRASSVLRPADTNFGGESTTLERASGADAFASTTADEKSVPVCETAESSFASINPSGSERPYRSKTTLQLDKLSADKYAKAVAQRNPLASSLGNKTTASDIASAMLVAPESLAGALSAKTQNDLSPIDEPAGTKTKLNPLSKVKAAITSKLPAMDRDQKTAAQLRETVKESPLLATQPMPSSKRKSTVQTMHPVCAPHRARY